MVLLEGLEDAISSATLGRVKADNELLRNARS
jgi:hypothetical protein